MESTNSRKRKSNDEKIERCLRKIQRIEKRIEGLRASKNKQNLSNRKALSGLQDAGQSTTTIQTETPLDIITAPTGSKETNKSTKELPAEVHEVNDCSVESNDTTNTSEIENSNPEMENTDDELDSTDDEFDREYMPQCWSTKFATPEEVLQKHIQFITTESVLATNSIPNELDVSYGPTNGQKLDILGTDLPDDAPILVYVHGGDWKQISRDQSRFPARSMHAAGVKTFVVGYDQGPDITLWDISDQVLDAISYVLRYAKEKSSRGIYLAGHGSGAHLIAKILSNDELFDFCQIDRLQGVFLISGLYDLRNFSDTHANSVINLPKIDEISFSPIFQSYNHLEHTNMRFYVLAAENDSPTYKSQARDFYDFLFNLCPTGNMFFEIKDDMDHYEMVQCLSITNNYLRNLIVHDLSKYSNMHSTK